MLTADAACVLALSVSVLQGVSGSRTIAGMAESDDDAASDATVLDNEPTPHGKGGAGKALTPPPTAVVIVVVVVVIVIVGISEGG